MIFPKSQTTRFKARGFVATALFAVISFGLILPASSLAAEHQGERNASTADTTQTSPSLPRHGEAMSSVKARLGSPQDMKPAVGEPPITRWIYPDFIVFFEGDRVIHTVEKKH
ncbi:hypothetical protein QQM79_11305 [Marinobacteraceae bacterium S3BR75-40.1]